MRKLFAALTLCAGVSLAQQPVTGSGTAGTAAPGVITVQGISSMIPVSVNLSQEGGSSITATPTAYGSAPSGNVIGVNALPQTKTHRSLRRCAKGIRNGPA